MNNIQAEDIVHGFAEVIARDENAFKKQSDLPCSKAKIREAFYVYIQAIIEKLGTLPKNIGDNLVECYCMIEDFLPDDEANRLNDIGKKNLNKQLDIGNPEDAQKWTEYTSKVADLQMYGKSFDEINDFIRECYNKKK